MFVIQLATELYFDWSIYKNTIWCEQKYEQKDHYPRNTKFFKKYVFNPKTLINFRNSLKNWLSEDPWCSYNKQKSLPRAQYVSHPPWRKKLSCYSFVKAFYLVTNSSVVGEIIEQYLTRRVWNGKVLQMPDTKIFLFCISD